MDSSYMHALTRPSGTLQIFYLSVFVCLLSIYLKCPPGIESQLTCRISCLSGPDDALLCIAL